MSEIFTRLCTMLLVLSTAFPAAIAPTAGPPDNALILTPCAASASAGPVRVASVRAYVEVKGGRAATRLHLTIRNDGPAVGAARLLIPAPAGAANASVAIPARVEAVVTAAIAAGDRAVAWLEGHVAATRDPAMLEFAADDLIRTSAFSMAAAARLEVVVTYDAPVRRVGRRAEIVIPRSESLAYRTPWEVELDLHDAAGIVALYSPSHRLADVRRTPTTAKLSIPAAAMAEPGPVRLTWVAGEHRATVFTSPDDSGEGGHFLFVGEAPDVAGAARLREVTVVVDRSGSMRGRKIEQAREAALQVIHGLAAGESFNLIVYNGAVESFAPAPVIKSDESAAAAEAWLSGVQARGGTNLHAALELALTARPTAERLPLVIFLTDGLPTAGITEESAIRGLAENANPHHRRVFTFGVGVDVNTALLSAIAAASRARPTFVLPGQDVEVAVGGLFRRLHGPALTSPVIEACSTTGDRAPGRILDVVPGRLPDYFRSDTVVVAGRYVGPEPFVLRVRGAEGEGMLTAAVRQGARDRRYPFVRRIWASRRIAELVAMIRRAGAEGGKDAAATKEVAAEIVALSTEFGIITEYTEFMSRESCDLSDDDANVAAAASNLEGKAQGIRWGSAAVNQDFNNDRMLSQTCENRRNGYVSSDLSRKEVGGVQQIGGRAFFRRGKRWIDGRARKSGKPDLVIKIGSPQYLDLSRKLRKDGRHVLLAVQGELEIEVDGKVVLILPD